MKQQSEDLQATVRRLEGKVDRLEAGQRHELDPTAPDGRWHAPTFDHYLIRVRRHAVLGYVRYVDRDCA
jgi:hypothetical protein